VCVCVRVCVCVCVRACEYVCQESVVRRGGEQDAEWCGAPAESEEEPTGQTSRPTCFACTPQVTVWVQAYEQLR
jgi:hypothetical protein